MISFRLAALSVLCAAVFSSLGAAQDLSKYRNFEFGMSVEAVAKLAAVSPAGAKRVHQSSELIQRLDWNVYGYFDISKGADSARNMRFDFYKDQLFRIVVTYDSGQTSGLTTQDLIESLSGLYGPATEPETTITVSGFQTYNDSQQVLARWEDTEYSYNLFRSSYGSSFGLVAFSKRLELMASATDIEAERLDKLEAPARETARQKKQAEDEQAAQDKARLINKPKFRP